MRRAVSASFPNLPDEKIVQVGNAAIEGASIALLSVSRRRELEALVRRVEHCRLETHPEFFDFFVEGCQFKPVESPHRVIGSSMPMRYPARRDSAAGRVRPAARISARLGAGRTAARSSPTGRATGTRQHGRHGCTRMTSRRGSRQDGDVFVMELPSPAPIANDVRGRPARTAPSSSAASAGPELEEEAQRPLARRRSRTSTSFSRFSDRPWWST